MRMTDVYSAKALASVFNEPASNKIPYLGEGLFPSKKKAGLDLKWVKTSKGLPVALAPSAFDTVSPIRSRSGFEMAQNQMAFFKESMLIKEEDEQEIMRVQESTDPFAQEVIDRIYSDAQTLVEGADVVPEQMRMQLLSSATSEHGPAITIATKDANYSYDYDPNKEYVANNFMEIATATDKWSDTENSDPLADVQKAQDKVEERTGTKPEYLIVSKQTMNYLKQNKKLKSYILSQNLTANVVVTDARVKEVFSSELGVTIIVYSKLYKDQNGQTQKFYPDGYATLIPSGDLGNTWYGMTPDERTGIIDKSKDVAIVKTGVAVAVKLSDDPVQTKTTVSEITLPSFERMDETFQIKCY